MKKLFKFVTSLICIVMVAEVCKHTEQIEKLNKEIEELKAAGKGE